MRPWRASAATPPVTDAIASSRALQSAHAAGRAGDLGDLLHDYDSISARVENWFLCENDTADCYQAIEEITFVTARLEQSGAAAGYLALPSVAAVGGSWMVAPELIATGNYDAVTDLAREAVRIGTSEHP